MAERPEDLNLPLAVVSRIIKESLSDNINVSKEARQAISKAASVFVLYATSCANNFALKGKRKTLAANDIFQAMEEMEFERFVPELKKSWEAFTSEKQAKLEKKKQQKEGKENEENVEKDGEKNRGDEEEKEEEVEEEVGDEGTKAAPQSAPTEAASMEAASMEAASMEAASTEAASTEAASTEAASTESASKKTFGEEQSTD